MGFEPTPPFGDQNALGEGTHLESGALDHSAILTRWKEVVLERPAFWDSLMRCPVSLRRLLADPPGQGGGEPCAGRLRLPAEKLLENAGFAVPADCLASPVGRKIESRSKDNPARKPEGLVIILSSKGRKLQ